MKKHEDTMISLGSISTEDLLKLLGLQMKAFDGKAICDYGAGLSDFLQKILEGSDPAMLTAVDPMYISVSAIEAAKKQTHSRLLELEHIFNEPHNELEVSRKRINERLTLLKNYHHEIEGVERKASLDESDIGAYDFMFMTFSFDHIPSPVASLEKIKRYLKPGGRIIITTFENTMDTEVGQGWRTFFRTIARDDTRSIIVIEPETTYAS